MVRNILSSLITFLPLNSLLTQFKTSDYPGDYELVLDAANKVMMGCKKGDPTNWRKLQFIRSLDVSALESVPSHDHTNEHVHGEHCGHHDH
jgi:hypothetical protein